MNKIYNIGLGLTMMLGVATSLTSCIEETEPTNIATSEQIAGSNSAAEALVMAIPANFTSIWDASRHWSFGYPAVMHIRDVLTQDLATHDESGYNQFWSFQENVYMGRDYIFLQFPWNFFTKFVRSSNNVIALINEESATEVQKGYLGVALAFRAMCYLDMARAYEFLPNDGTQAQSPEGNPVERLTAPIITESITEAEARNNPRATHEEMFEFIINDLKRAETLIPNFTKNDKTLPHLDCVYGLMARAYMWNEDYANAEKYARKAIEASSTGIMTKNDCLDTRSGFNDKSKWMWGGQYVEGNVSNLINWTAFMANEAVYGYAGPAAFGGGGATVMIDAAMYDRMSNTDFRKLMFKAPAGSALEGQNLFINQEIGDALPELSSLKFRPNQGDCNVYSTGNISGIPVMRVEEMYFIEAEAAAHQDESRGKALVEKFMKENRDPQYTCTAASKEDIVEEIVFQKRVELWGEGQSFFDIKRLNYPTQRGYVGTNHANAARFNTTTRAAWMNWCFVKTEENANAGLRGYNNPDPTGAYNPWTENN